jgi:hypothetical protein
MSQHTTITREEVEKLVQVQREAINAFLNGDMEGYLALAPHAHNSSFMPPFGGRPVVYKDRRPSILAAADYFRGGAADIELVSWHAAGDSLVVLVMIERQYASVGGLPEQDWSLRVTQVHERDDGSSGWRVVHRHADPLVQRIGLDGAAVLAKGQGGSIVVE